MGKIINPNTAGKDRLRLLKSIALAIGKIKSPLAPNKESRDLIAFISLALDAIVETVEQTVIPWERRGYWVKADKFRRDWAWTESYNNKLRENILHENWADVDSLIQAIYEKLPDMKVPRRKQVRAPWDGAWDKFISKKSVT